MSRYNVSDDYCYPGTEVLRNKANLQNQNDLDEFEAHISAFRLIELQETPIKGAFDLDHLKKIHFHIFQDVYDWAGEIRTVDLSRGSSTFANVNYIESSSKTLFDELAKDNYLKNLSTTAMAGKIAYYLSEINAIHPFREGNGRAQRAFISQLCSNAGFMLDYSGIEPEEFLDAMIYAYNGHEVPLINIITKSLI